MTAKFLTMLLVGEAVLITLSGTPAARAVNIAPNPGFEIEGDEGPASAAGWNHFYPYRDDSFPASGTWAMRFETTVVTSPWLSATNYPISNGFPVVPGTEIWVEMDYAWDQVDRPSPISAAFVELNFTTRNNHLGFVRTYLTDTGGVYEHFRAGPILVPEAGPFPNDQVGVSILVILSDRGQTEQMWVDNFVLDATPVPEPAMGGWCLLATCLLMRHRRGTRGGGPNAVTR